MLVVKASDSLRPVFVRAVVGHQASVVLETVLALWVVPGITRLNALCCLRKILQTYFWRQRALEVFDLSLFS